MEVLVSFVAGIARDAGRLCFASLYSTIQSAHRFDPEDWEREIKNLLDLRNYIKHQVESTEQDGRSPAIKVKKWLRDVGKFEIKANKMRASITSQDNSSLCGFGCAVRLQAARMLKKAERLLEDGCFPAGLMSNYYLTKAVEHMPVPSIEDETTASRTLAVLVKKLEDLSTHRIGVWGLGGVGKTTLVKNLNNKLNTDSSNRQFSMVIWAAVSNKDSLDIKRVQVQIAERLNLEVKMEESVERTAIRLHQRLKEESFLLILDDVWQSIDLDDVGIPRPESHKGSKIVLTSRSFDVCRQMMTDSVVKVSVLNEDEAWKLFSQKAGEVATLLHIIPFAQAVARECGGLPLALIIVGTAMRGKTTVELWKHALKELQTLGPCINGTRDKVYTSLKWSYDALKGNNTKSCFLYCALYPEDFSIEVHELVQCWLTEGLIDELQSFEESENYGIAVVQTLKDSCLLEDGAYDGSVKMHDLVRDVALWIASSEGEFKSLSRSGIGLGEILVSELSNSLRRVSYATNEISELPDCGGKRTNVLTLLLQGNLPLKEVPERFLQGFQAVRVLNISRTSIQSLPPLHQLSDLHSLLLADCFALGDISALGSAGKLQFLDLSATRIRELPKEMESLANLRQVDLSRTHYLNNIPAGIISKWTCLEVLDMTLSGYQWCFEKVGQTTVEELGFLTRLDSLFIRLEMLPGLHSGHHVAWMGRLRRFQFFIGEAANSLPTVHDNRRVIISRLDVSGDWIAWSMTNASSLVLNSCGGLSTALPSLVTCSALSFSNTPRMAGNFVGLKSLIITTSSCLLSPNESTSYPDRDLLPNLEELRLHNIRHLKSIMQLADHLGLLFLNLKLIEVVKCRHMKYLLPYADEECLTLPNLETLVISFCKELQDLFIYHSSSSNTSSGVVNPVVPNVRTLELHNLPQLKTLCRSKETWPSLEQIDIFQCHRVEKLPLTVQNVKTLKVIRAEQQWWKQLQWDFNDDALRGVEQFCVFGTCKSTNISTPFPNNIQHFSKDAWVSALPGKAAFKTLFLPNGDSYLWSSIYSLGFSYSCVLVTHHVMSILSNGETNIKQILYKEMREEKNLAFKELQKIQFLALEGNNVKSCMARIISQWTEVIE